MTNKIPFDPGRVAKAIEGGEVVYLGDCIVLFRRNNHLVRQCRRCVLEETQTFKPATIIEESEVLTKFIFKHQHKDLS